MSRVRVAKVISSIPAHVPCGTCMCKVYRHIRTSTHLGPGIRSHIVLAFKSASVFAGSCRLIVRAAKQAGAKGKQKPSKGRGNVSYGADWYEQTRSYPKFRTVREELGEHPVYMQDIGALDMMTHM